MPRGGKPRALPARAPRRRGRAARSAANVRVSWGTSEKNHESTKDENTKRETRNTRVWVQPRCSTAGPCFSIRVFVFRAFVIDRPSAVSLALRQLAVLG